MTVSVVVPQTIAEELESAARLPVETAGVLLAGIAEAPNGDTRLLVRGMRWVAEEAYSRREWNGLGIRSEGYVPALSEADTMGAACIWVHTHPGRDASPRPSDHDYVVDREIVDLFRLRSGSPYYGALIFSPRPEALAFTGHLQREGRNDVQIERLWQIGDRWRLIRAFDSLQPPLSPIFDRNVRAFGSAVQETLGDLKIAVVGRGGTGSAVAEQLVRLGVRQLVLVDPDDLSESNVTRVYGSAEADVGQPKVEVLARHLARIAPQIRCEKVQSMITLEPAARRLVGCDIVFGCTDDNAGRLILSRLATYLLVPVIDCGVLLSSNANGELTGIDGRVTILSPGQACLICRNRIDLARAGAEVLARHLARIAPQIRCEKVQSMITLEPAARRLVGCDIVFGCTDDNAGRLILSRLATYLLVPVIDCGVLLSSNANGELTGIDGRVTILSPGQACLICRNRIDLARAGAELLTPDERVRREDEGYAPALARTEPAVVTFTTAVAAAAVSELLERLIGYGPEPRPSEVLLRCHEREQDEGD